MKFNTLRESHEMAQNDSQQNPAAFFNVYKVSLTREQQKALSMLLPTKYSFQPFKVTRSVDQESLKSQPKPIKKKPAVIASKEAKDPDFSISHMPASSIPKEPKPVKIESSQVIPGGEPFMECYLILKKLKKSLYSWPFKQPVDPKALGIPQYLNIVLQPIDLKTIEEILKREGYKHPAEFHRDIYKMMMNSYKFNQKNTEVYQTTKEFQQEYLKIVKEAKDGKLVCPDKKIRPEENMQEGTSFREKTSQQPISQPIKPLQKQQTKKQKPEKIIQSKSFEKILNKQRQEKQKLKEKDQFQKLKFQDQYQYNDNFMNAQAYNSYQGEEPKAQNRSQFQPDEYLELKQSKAESKLHKEDYQPSFSNEPSKKNKSKTLKESKIKEKKPKKIFQTNQSPNELKEMKENTQVENEKSFYFNQIKNKLTDLLKKLNDYQLPNKIKNKNITKIQGFEHPNFNNFVTITAAEKKKLAEKISLLPMSELKYVIQICFRNKRSKTRDEEGVYEIDLQKLDPKTLKQLSNFVGMRIKKTKKESYKYIKEEIKAGPEQQIIEEEVQNEIVDEVEDQQIEQQNSLNQQMQQRSYQNLLYNQEHDFNDRYNDRNYAPQFEMIDSEIHDNRNDYSQEFPF